MLKELLRLFSISFSPNVFFLNLILRAGIVEKPEEYRYSSAKDYAGEKGLLGIEIVMRQRKTYK